MGAFVAVVVPVWLAQPSLCRLRIAAPVGVATAVIIGLIAAMPPSAESEARSAIIQL
jgi:ABC-type uncharacterized transport system permease subunit